MKELNIVAGVVLIFIQVPWIVHSHMIGNDLIANLRLGKKSSNFLYKKKLSCNRNSSFYDHILKDRKNCLVV
jgi:hypothetical protein